MSNTLKNRNANEIRGEGSPSKQPKKFLKRVKNIGITGLAATLIGGTAAYIDITNANQRKKNDREKYGAIELKNDEEKTYENASNNIVYLSNENGRIDSLRLQDFLDETLSQNGYNPDSITSTDLLTTLTSENALKTDGRIIEQDRKLEKLGVERSRTGESITGKILSRLGGNGSYGRFQTQREAIENGYKNNPIRYQSICKKIVNFKLPNKEGNREELYKQLQYKTEDEMISDLKEKNLPIYTGGDRLGIALGIVLLNEQLIDRNEGWKKYKEEEVINKTQKVKAKYLSTLKRNNSVRQALNREGSKGENLKSLYILSKSNELSGLNRVSFSDIQKTLQSPEFKAGEIAAGRCTDVEARKNGEYLLDLSIAELNQRFNNEINGNNSNISITPPTGTFGPTSKKLALKHLDFLPNEIKDNSSSESIKNYLNQHPELVKRFKDQVIADYIINFQRLFLLNGTKEEIKQGKSNRNELNEKQMGFLEQNLNLSFNHLYISIQCFQEYVKANRGTTEKLDNLRNDYITNVENDDIQKEKRKKIVKILSHKKEFMETTGLKNEKYESFIKHNLGPALIGTSIILSETGNVVPENQTPKSKTSNETNSIYRFYAGTKNQIEKINENRKGIYIMTTTSGNISIKKIRENISKNPTIMEYLQNNYRDLKGNPITDIDSISDEIIEHFINIQSINNGKKIYFNTRDTEQIIGEEKLLCVVRGKGDTFCDYIFDLQQQNDTLSAILKRIIGKDSIELKDITKGVVRQLIRKPDGSLWENPNEIHPKDTFLIVYPLTSGKPQAIDTSNVTPILTILPSRDNLKATTKTTKEEIGKTLSEKPNAKDGAKGKRNIQNSRKKVPLPKRSSTPAKRHTHQKR